MNSGAASETSQPRPENPAVDKEQFAVTGSPNLTTREEGVSVSGQPTSETLRGEEGGDGRILAEGEGVEICKGRGGAGVEMETGEEVAEMNKQNSRSVIGLPDAHILSLQILRLKHRDWLCEAGRNTE